jgi:ribonuclease HI
MLRIPGKFHTLLNKTLIMPTATSRIQTDGSYNYKTKVSRTATILTINNLDYNNIKVYYDHTNSMESEWASLIDGLEYSQKNNIKSLAIENDCLPVIRSIITENPPKNIRFLEYYKYFNSLRNNYKWLGIRWIPRELNRADDLFRI